MYSSLLNTSGKPAQAETVGGISARKGGETYLISPFRYQAAMSNPSPSIRSSTPANWLDSVRRALGENPADERFRVIVNDEDFAEGIASSCVVKYLIGKRPVVSGLCAFYLNQTANAKVENGMVAVVTEEEYINHAGKYGQSQSSAEEDAIPDVDEGLGQVVAQPGAGWIQRT